MRHAPLTVALGGMIAMAAAMGIGRFVYTPILPYMADALLLERSEAGLIAAANFLGYLVGAMAGATGFLRGNRRNWALGALAVSGLTTAAMAATVSIPLFLILRFLGGVCSAFVMVFGSALVFDRLAAAGRSELSHVHFAGVGVGISVSAVLVAGLGPAGIGWSGQWIASGAVALAALVAVVFMIPVGEGSAAPPPQPGDGGFDRRMIPLIVAYGLFGFGYVITATFISAMVRETPSIASIEPYVWLVVGLTAVPSVALWTWIGRKIGNPASIALACLAEGAGVAATVLIDDPLAVLVGAGLLGGTFMGITAVGLITARQLAVDTERGDPRRAIALLTGSFGAGQMIGPIFAGYAAETTGDFTTPSLVAAGGLVVSAGLAISVRMAKA
ncbi:MAG: YbfB/YjiJ family MFS transporter [Alphaproteobacteria bacterium]